MMNSYEILIFEKEYCERMAKIYLERQDSHLAAFYQNAAVGFKDKSEKVQISDII